MTFEELFFIVALVVGVLDPGIFPSQSAMKSAADYGLTLWLKKPVIAAHRQAIPILSSEWGDVANSEWLPDDLVAACGAG